MVSLWRGEAVEGLLNPLEQALEAVCALEAAVFRSEESLHRALQHLSGEGAGDRRNRMNVRCRPKRPLLFILANDSLVPKPVDHYPQQLEEQTAGFRVKFRASQCKRCGRLPTAGWHLFFVNASRRRSQVESRPVMLRAMISHVFAERLCVPSRLRRDGLAATLRSALQAEDGRCPNEPNRYRQLPLQSRLDWRH